MFSHVANSPQLSLPSEGSSAATATQVHQAESVATARGRAAPEEMWRDRIFLLLCSLLSVFSFYNFHSSPNIFLLFSSSSPLNHEPTLSSYHSQWVQPLPFEPPSTDASCALSQARIISCPPRLALNLCTSFPPTAFPSPVPRVTQLSGWG